MPSDIATDLRFLAEQRSKAAARAARFSAAAAQPPPPLPVRSMAWPGGKLTHNKEDAVRKFIARKRETDGLSVEAETQLIASLSPRGSAAVQSPDGVAAQSSRWPEQGIDESPRQQQSRRAGSMASADAGTGHAQGTASSQEAVDLLPTRAKRAWRRRSSTLWWMLLSSKGLGSTSRMRTCTVRAFFSRSRVAKRTRR